MNNLRSVVSSFAVDTLGYLYIHLQKGMDQELEATVKVLLQKAGQTNNFIRQAVDAALGCMVQYCTATRSIGALLSVGVRSGFILLPGQMCSSAISATRSMIRNIYVFSSLLQQSPQHSCETMHGPPFGESGGESWCGPPSFWYQRSYREDLTRSHQICTRRLTQHQVCGARGFDETYVSAYPIRLF